MIKILFILVSASFNLYAGDIVINEIDEKIWDSYESLPVTIKQKLTIMALRDFKSKEQIIAKLKEITQTNLAHLKEHDELKNGYINRIFFCADFTALALIKADFSNTLLINCVFEKMNLSESNFYGSTLISSNFKDADLKQVDLQNSIAVNAYFFGATLTGANMSGADLRQAYFNSSELQHSNFTKAKLSGASFDGASMENSFRDWTIPVVGKSIERKLNKKWLKKKKVEPPHKQIRYPSFS